MTLPASPDCEPYKIQAVIQVNVFVVENAPEIRSRLIKMLRTVAGINVVGEADSVNKAIEGVLGSAADTLLLDLQLKDGSGLDVLARVKTARPALRAIVLTNLVSPQYREASLSAGAECCLDKSREFGLVPEILRGWIEAASDRPVA